MILKIVMLLIPMVRKSKNKLTDIIAAKNYLVNGGKLETIKNKYDLTAAQEKELNTL